LGDQWLLAGIYSRYAIYLARLHSIYNHIDIANATRFQTTKVAVEDTNFLREAPLLTRLCAGEKMSVRREHFIAGRGSSSASSRILGMVSMQEHMIVPQILSAVF
jgi:hypothetical protein